MAGVLGALSELLVGRRLEGSACAGVGLAHGRQSMANSQWPTVFPVAIKL